jgi:hypothetical protein
MSTALSVVRNDGHELSELEQLEQEINSAAYEAFVFIGQRLAKIRKDRMYENEGYKSWSAYCAAGRIEYGKRQADRYITASLLRPKLGTSKSHDWRVRDLEELAKCETDREAKTVAKKVIAEAKRTGERVTARLIAEIRDSRTTKPEKDLEAASLDTHLDKLASLALRWRTSLEKVDLIQWEDVDKTVMTRAITEVSALLKFLKT